MKKHILCVLRELGGLSRSEILLVVVAKENLKHSKVEAISKIIDWSLEQGVQSGELQLDSTGMYSIGKELERKVSKETKRPAPAKATKKTTGKAETLQPLQQVKTKPGEKISKKVSKIPSKKNKLPINRTRRAMGKPKPMQKPTPKKRTQRKVKDEDDN
ncbi:uncharacterized protein DMAD_00629 [Drosophila madeirensis]|uniref:Uncharacterized protein n=2 Tax=Drosophila madeirensis TaxID=30013 RepID=A0AAU9FZ59_DROMD